jgi:hypothetical protein
MAGRYIEEHQFDKRYVCPDGQVVEYVGSGKMCVTIEGPATLELFED